jgi:ABC-type transport system involved in cytochrome bd biosynthesis fused ATPase/permease subunit
MMSQFPAFFHDTLRENLRIAKPDATDEELISICRTTGMLDILEAKGLTHDSNLAGGQILSGGQKKLLALTRCLLRMPAILFLDEPTAGVDNNEKFKLLEMLCRATEGKTVVVVDHDVNWLLQFCDYFVGLNEGRTIESGTLVEVLTNRSVIYQLEATLRFSEAEPEIGRRKAAARSWRSAQVAKLSIPSRSRASRVLCYRCGVLNYPSAIRWQNQEFFD